MNQPPGPLVYQPAPFSESLLLLQYGQTVPGTVSTSRYFEHEGCDPRSVRTDAYLLATLASRHTGVARIQYIGVARILYGVVHPLAGILGLLRSEPGLFRMETSASDGQIESRRRSQCMATTHRKSCNATPISDTDRCVAEEQ